MFHTMRRDRSRNDSFQRLELVILCDKRHIKLVCRFLAITGQTTIEFWTRRAEKADPEIADV